jgi:hypothetical protein
MATSVKRLGVNSVFAQMVYKTAQISLKCSSFYNSCKNVLCVKIEHLKVSF